MTVEKDGAQGDTPSTEGHQADSVDIKEGCGERPDDGAQPGVKSIPDPLTVAKKTKASQNSQLRGESTHM